MPAVTPRIAGLAGVGIPTRCNLTMLVRHRQAHRRENNRRPTQARPRRPGPRSIQREASNRRLGRVHGKGSRDSSGCTLQVYGIHVRRWIYQVIWRIRSSHAGRRRGTIRWSSGARSRRRWSSRTPPQCSVLGAAPAGRIIEWTSTYATAFVSAALTGFVAAELNADDSLANWRRVAPDLLCFFSGIGLVVLPIFGALSWVPGFLIFTDQLLMFPATALAPYYMLRLSWQTNDGSWCPR